MTVSNHSGSLLNRPGWPGKPLAEAQTQLYNGARQSWETLMDDEVPIASETENVTFPWLAA